jgi:hypothetical protein
VPIQFADFFNSSNLRALGLDCPSSPAPDGRIGDVARAATARRGMRMTVQGCERARKNGAHCIGISDSLLSPLAPR